MKSRSSVHSSLAPAWLRRTSFIIACVAVAVVASVTLRAQAAKVAIDLKTKFSEKFELAPAKNGADLLLMESDWGKPAEFGEDYALWLRNATHERRGDTMIVVLDVELRTGSLFQEGDLLATRHVRVMYDVRDDWKLHAGSRATNVVRTGETVVAVAAAIGETVYPAAAHVAGQVINAVEQMMPEDYEEMKLEAMVVGSEVVRAAREMVEERRRQK